MAGERPVPTPRRKTTTQATGTAPIEMATSQPASPPPPPPPPRLDSVRLTPGSPSERPRPPLNTRADRGRVDHATTQPEYVTVVTRQGLWWVMLAYRVPREPSTPRIAVWRRLRSLGVAQVGDGLVALPEDARTREQLEWMAADVDAAGGSAILWRAEMLSTRDEQQLIEKLEQARAEEYRALIVQVEEVRTTSEADQARSLAPAPP